jgi:F-type H+-transporting ATPase subunit b
MPSTVGAESNFLVPNATILVEVVMFFVFLGVLAKWVLPPILDAVAQRQKVIRDRVAEAEEAKKRLASAEADYQKALADARHEASRIRETAREQGAAVIAEARERAQDEARRILDEARRTIEADRERAFGELRGEVGRLATDLAGRIVGESLTDEAGRDQTIDRFLADLDEKAAKDQTGAAKTVRTD